MRWPWQQVEQRSDDATDVLVDAILNAANTSEPAAEPTAVGIVEGAIGVWSRAFAGAVPSDRAEALTPEVLADLGRRLLTNGEAVWTIEITDRLELWPARITDVEGGRSPRTWRYILDQEVPYIGGPQTVERTLPAAAVVHCRINPRPPWRGRSPFELADLTGRMAALVERTLLYDAGTAAAHVLPLPKDPDEGDNALDGLKAAIRKARGRLVMTETTAGGWGEGAGRTPRQDYVSHRLGADPPAGLVGLRSNAERSLLHASGVPAALLFDAPAASQQAALRRFLRETLRPTALMIRSELRDKLDAPALDFDFSELRTIDPGAARSYGIYRSHNVEHSEALRLSGLE